MYIYMYVYAPFVQVPNMDGFDLKPYVSRNTPVVSNAHPYSYILSTYNKSQHVFD